MKIVLLHGQTHKGSSYHMGRMLLDTLGGSHNVSEYFLPADLNHFCLGCYQCVQDETRCPFYGDKEKIMGDIRQADLLIFTTPAYCMRASAGMKAFMDLTFTYWMPHKPNRSMFHKKAVVLSTAAGSGAKSATKDIANMLFYWGVPYVKQVGVAVQAMRWENVSPKKKKSIQKSMVSVAKGVLRPTARVPFKTKAMFHFMRMMQKANWGASPEEKEYWDENGWLGKKRPWSS